MASGSPPLKRDRRSPSLLDALIPVVVLVALIALTIVLFGIGSTDGPLQVALLTSALVAGLVAFKNGVTVAEVRDAAVGGVSTAMGAIFILLAVGALIGTFNLAGTIPIVVSYGLRLLNPVIFYPVVALICALVGAVTGSSWTTAGTLGVAFVGMAPALGLNEPIAAGAVISGAYMGDKMSPLSETTVLVPSIVGGVTVSQHIRGMLTTVAPAFLLALLIFLVVGLTHQPSGATLDVKTVEDKLGEVFRLSPVNLMPIVLLVLLSILRVPPFIAIFGTALLTGILASFTQPELVRAFVGQPEQGPVLNGIEAIYKATATGFQLQSGNEKIDSLFSRGGMVSMLTTVWLILGALSFAAIMEHAGFLDRLMTPLLRVARSPRSLIGSVVATCIGLNVIAGDQYVADVLPARAYRRAFASAGLAPRMLSRTVEDSGTVTSPLVPWNSCGAYMTGVLGIPTIEYLPYAFFNIINPLLAILFGLIGFRIDRIKPSVPAPTTADLNQPITDGGTAQ